MVEENEWRELKQQVRELETKQNKHDELIYQLMKDFLRIIHIGIGLIIGLVLHKLGIEWILNKLF